MAASKVEEKAVRQVVPAGRIQREKEAVAKTVMGLVSREVRRHPGVAVGAELGGSYAKGTWLAQNADIDVFVKFGEDVPDERFRKTGERIGFGALKGFGPYVRYSDHPYVEANVGGTKVNVVPCYDVKSGAWKSAADRSQFHTRFMCKNLDGRGRDQVRLLKQFLMASGIYGAEISMQGFSGYVAEVLVWNLGGFRSVLERFAGVGEGGAVEVGKAGKRFDSTVIIADPVDENRNLGAAISDQNFSRLVLASRAYLKRPAAGFFRRGKRRRAPGRAVLERLVLVEFCHSGRSPDIIWGQVKRASDSLATQLGVGGFCVIRNTAVVVASSAAADAGGRAVLAFLLESPDISKMRLKEGPTVFGGGGADSDRFVEKNLKRSRLLWVGRDMRVLALEDREFSNAGRFLRNLLDAGSGRSGIPKGLRADLKKGFRVSVGGRGIRKSIMEELREFVTTDEKIFSAYGQAG